MKKVFALASILGGLALPAMAQNYAQFDMNGDGMVTFSELRASGVRVNGQVRALDRNNDRVLSRRELGFDRGYGSYQQYPVNGYRWSTMDTNRNGVLESYELNQAGYQSTGNYNMYNVDLNRDGYISRYEADRAGYNRPNTGNTVISLLQALPDLINP